MDRVRLIAKPLPKEAIDIKIVKREWGVERSYKTSNGREIFTSAPYLN